MAIFSTKIENVNEAFLTTLKALYDIEKQLEIALPKMQEASNDATLKENFGMHLIETRNHIDRLEQAFQILNEEPDTIKCEGIRGIIEDGEWVIQNVEAPEMIKDSMIAHSARHAEHYEMSGYMGAIIQADALGHEEIVFLLNETLREEEAADKKLEMAEKENFK
jgi:ferritin-like metal-binding protein YciE